MNSKRISKIEEEYDIKLLKLVGEVSSEIIRESQVNWSLYYDELNSEIDLDEQSIFDVAFNRTIEIYDLDMKPRDLDVIYDFVYEKVQGVIYEIAYENIKELSTEVQSFEKDPLKHNGISRSDFI